MTKKDKDRKIDKNFFKAMNYEIAGELGILDNEEMKNNRRIDKKKDKTINPSWNAGVYLVYNLVFYERSMMVEIIKKNSIWMLDHNT